MSKSYSELMNLETFEERFRYLKLNGKVGADTFGCHRYLNQILYKSEEWKRFRRKIIIRDNGNDLGIEGREIKSKLLVHHINPITIQDVTRRDPKIFDPENVITTCHNTHQAIHYGDENLLIKDPVVRRKNDTCPWKR